MSEREKDMFFSRENIIRKNTQKFKTGKYQFRASNAINDKHQQVYRGWQIPSPLRFKQNAILPAVLIILYLGVKAFQN